MHRPKQRAKPGGTKIGLSQHPPKEEGRARIHRHVQQMIRERIQTDDFVESPEERDGQRIINCPRGRPNFFESERSNNARILGQVIGVVPDESDSQSKGLRCEHEQDDHDRAEMTFASK